MKHCIKMNMCDALDIICKDPTAKTLCERFQHVCRLKYYQPSFPCHNGEHNEQYTQFKSNLYNKTLLGKTVTAN